MQRTHVEKITGRLRQRQREIESSSQFWLAFYPDFAAVWLDKTTRNCQSTPGSTPIIISLCAGRFTLIEAGKNIGQVAGWNPRVAIVDTDLHAVFFAASQNRDFSAGPRVTDGVIEDVIQYALNFVCRHINSINLILDLTIEHYLLLIGLCFHRAQCIRDEIAQ